MLPDTEQHIFNLPPNQCLFFKLQLLADVLLFRGVELTFLELDLFWYSSSIQSSYLVIFSIPASVKMITFVYLFLRGRAFIFLEFMSQFEENRIIMELFKEQIIIQLKILNLYNRRHWGKFIIYLQKITTTINQLRNMKRQGTDIHELQQQCKKTNRLCFWGIQKCFDPKQCYRYFKKNFGEHDNVTHLLKLKNKPFFILQFKEELNCEQFNKDFGKNKRVRAKLVPQDIYQKNHIKEQDFVVMEQIIKRGQKNTKQASPEQLQKVRSTKIEDIVAPLHSLPYEQQVQQKKRDINRIIENYNTQYFRDAEVLRLIKQEQKELPPLKMDQFIECPTNREFYRTKCQFTIGRDDKGAVVIGFNKGNYHNNTIMVESPKNVNIVSKSMKFMLALVQNFIREIIADEEFADFDTFDRVQQVGFWRYLVVRQSQRTKQSMIIVVCKTQGFDQEKVAKIKQRLTQYLKKCIIGLKSLCFLPYNGQSDSIPPQKPLLLYGQPFYQQRIFNHTFQVSPSAFLQIHIDMCEILYSKIIEHVKECDIILDLGCGIGTIGISIMKKLENVKVIGVQICQEAVEDAKINEPTYQVHLGRVQDQIKAICEQHRGKRICAILDPPRPGFSKDVMLALRRCRGLDNLIYVACNAGAIQDNLLQLTLPTTVKRKAPEFIIKKMYGLDLFPQTNHFEALYIMERRQL